MDSGQAERVTFWHGRVGCVMARRTTRVTGTEAPSTVRSGMSQCEEWPGTAGHGPAGSGKVWQGPLWGTNRSSKDVC